MTLFFSAFNTEISKHFANYYFSKLPVSGNIQHTQALCKQISQVVTINGLFSIYWLFTWLHTLFTLCMWVLIHICRGRLCFYLSAFLKVSTSKFVVMPSVYHCNTGLLLVSNYIVRFEHFILASTCIKLVNNWTINAKRFHKMVNKLILTSAVVLLPHTWSKYLLNREAEIIQIACSK